MPTITVDTLIQAPIERVFDLARSIKTHALTTVWTGERVLSHHDHDLMDVGDVVTFEAKHFGLRQKLTAKITESQPPHSFVDEMLKGAFRSLRHEHQFSEVEGGTLMRDVMTFQGPGFGALDGVMLGPYMQRFLQRRGQELKRIAEATK